MDPTRRFHFYMCIDPIYGYSLSWQHYGFKPDLWGVFKYMPE